MPTKRELLKRIEKLEQQVFESHTKKTKNVLVYPSEQHHISFDHDYAGHPMFRREEYSEPTVNGKIEHILEHLGLEFKTEPKQTKTTGPTIELVKVKRETKKKAVKKNATRRTKK